MADVPEITLNDWLAQRLTPAKQQEGRWVEYAKIIQQYWEENFDPVLKDIEDSRSIYTASDQALARRLSELGDFYPVDSLIGGEDKILAIAWRNLALYFKDTRYLFDSTILRKFGSLDVKWVELYHRKDIPYGEEFLGAERIASEGGELNDYFLTCHGSVDVDQPTLDALGIPLETFVDQAWKEITAIRPAHIVFHGVQIFEEIPTTIPMGSFLKEADIVIIKPDLFDVQITDTTMFHPTFIRTAEVFTINEGA